MTRVQTLALLAGAALLSAGCPQPPRRMVEVAVQQNGHRVLGAAFEVPDGTTPGEAWFLIEGKTLTAPGPVPADPADPKAATLTGDVRVVVTRHGKEFVSARLDRLRLTRVFGRDDTWEIPREELERATRPALRPGFDKAKVP